MKKRALAIASFFIASVMSAAEADDAVDRELLLAAWTDKDSPSFVFVIHESTILYEFDMQERRYEIDGRNLVVYWENPLNPEAAPDPVIYRIHRLSAEELELQQEGEQESFVLFNTRLVHGSREVH